MKESSLCTKSHICFQIRIKIEIAISEYNFNSVFVPKSILPFQIILSTYSHKIRVTREVLLKMFNHSMELKMWDAKEKVSPRARFDRPKAFKLPPARGMEESEIENIKWLIERKPRGNRKLCYKFIV